MKRFAIVGMLAALFSGASLAQDFDLSWYTIDGGGEMFTTSVGAEYELSGTIGQPDAGEMSGGQYVLSGGFWAGAGGPPSCTGDLNHDGQVGVDDLAIFLSNYGVASGADPDDGDLDHDGDIDLQDMATMLSAYGSSCG